MILFNFKDGGYMKKVLIVEEEKPISNLIKISLTSEGYLCKCAFDGTTAANIIEKENFDLILLDIMLPGINGYELLEYIRPYKIPVIFIILLFVGIIFIKFHSSFCKKNFVIFRYFFI